MDENILFPSHLPAFLLTVGHPPFQGLLPDITQKFYCLFSTKHWKRNNLFSPSCLDPGSGLVLFGGVFDLQQVSEACLSEEHGANVVGNLFYSRWRKRRLWLLWTSPYLQEIADPRDFLWKVVWKLFTGPRNECETFFSF
jgi:hypothetical protein